MTVPYNVGSGSYATNYYYGDPWYYPHYPNTYRPYRVGWVCPKCGCGYNPDVQKCWTCGTNNATITFNQPVYTATATNTSANVEAEVGS